MGRSPSDSTETVVIENLRGVLNNVKLIGKGGMSMVFRAWQPSLERFVVIKRLKDELVEQADTAERFRREALALASVLHQNIAHVYDFVERPGEAFILMEYIEGVDLSALLEDVETIPPHVAACILLEVARGLSYIHERGMIHRDVKPSNIRLTNRGEVKLMDFGIVLQIQDTSLTRPGTMVGSPSYLSPEQILGDTVTHRADIFLLGIVFYEMLTGVRPFKEQDGQSIFQRIREGRYVEVRKMEPSVPRPLARIVEKCLRSDPDRRYGSVDKVISDLEEFLGLKVSTNPQKYILDYLQEQGVLQGIVNAERFPTQDEESRAGWWHRWWKPSAVILLVLVAFGLGFYLARTLPASVSGWVPIPPTASFAKPKPLPGHH